MNCELPEPAAAAAEQDVDWDVEMGNLEQKLGVKEEVALQVVQHYS